jgi:hypothetical protein
MQPCTREILLLEVPGTASVANFMLKQVFRAIFADGCLMRTKAQSPLHGNGERQQRR